MKGLNAGAIRAVAEALGLQPSADERYRLAADGNALLWIVRQDDSEGAFEDEPACFDTALARHAPDENAR